MLSTKKRILIISDVPFLPANEGNKRRIYDLILICLEKKIDVHFLYLGTDRQSANKMSKFLGAGFFWNEKKIFSRFLSWLGRLKKIVGWLLRIPYLRKYTLDEWYDKSINQYINELHLANKYDIVQVEYVYMSAALNIFPKNVLKIIDSHDVFSNRMEYIESLNLPNVWYSLNKEQERYGLSRSDMILAISKSDQHFFGVELGLDSLLVDCLIKPNFLETNPNAQSVFFIGSNNGMNRSGILSFIDKVMPIVVSKMPNFKLKIIGTVCNAVSDHENIEKLNIVECLDDVLKEALLFVNPVSIGTGMPIKLLEALARGIPTLSLSVGGRGLEDFMNDGVFIVNDLEEMADKLIWMIENQSIIREKRIVTYEKYVSRYDRSVESYISAIINAGDYIK